MTALGSIELMVPRTRRFSACAVLRAYARREAEVDRMILASFVLGLSTRKVGEALLPILGERVSAATVSQVAKVLDAAVAGFHARPLKGAYRQLVLDGVVLARKTGAGAIRRPVLVALGIRPDGRKEVIDFCLAGSESAAEWERFLTGLHRRGLDGAGLEMICVDGGQGLLAALPTVYPGVAVQRCWAHKIRNVLGKVRRADQPILKRDLHAVMNGQGPAPRPQRRPPLRRALVAALSESRRLPEGRPRRAPRLLPLQDPSRAQSRAHHQRHRAPLPRGSPKDKTHGRLLRSNQHGPHPLRRLLPRKPQPRRQCALPLTQTL